MTIKLLTYIDTFLGYGDSKGKDSLYISEMVGEMKKLEYINSFVILFNSQQPRLNDSLRAMIKIFTQIFGAERFYRNVILGFTRWDHSEKAEKKRKKSGKVFMTFSLWIFYESLAYISNGSTLV